MRAGSVLSVGLLAAGAALLAAAVLEGGAALALVVVVPVLYGRSLAFILGVALLVSGFFTLPLALGSSEPDDAPADGPTTPAAGTGGLVLVGPVPIFFGAWSGVSLRTRWLVALLGLAVLAVLVALALRAI